MVDSSLIGLMALAFLFGYAAGRIEAGGDLERQWKAGYLAGARATWAAIREDRKSGGHSGPEPLTVDRDTWARSYATWLNEGHNG